MNTNYNKTTFEHLGYYLDYQVDGKYIGSVINVIKQDTDVIGYDGRKTFILCNDLVLNNKKKIKKGTKVTTTLYPLCGRKI